MPKGWSDMTVTELETVASVLVEAAAQRPALTHKQVKVKLFLALTGLEVLESANPAKPVEEQYLVVCRRGHVERLVMYLWQMHYWMEEQMGWLDNPSNLLMFPYKEYKKWTWKGRHKYEGPSALMQNFQWRQYRIAGEYMGYFITESNRLVKMRESNVSASEIKKQLHAVARAKGLFLATLFNRKVKFVDAETKLIRKEFVYVSSQSIRNWRDFEHFSDVKFQVVLFWWTGTMNWLQKKYPKVFKSTNPKKNTVANPLELYTRQTATMEKYLGINEEELNRELYTNVLQHLQDMMDESDRMKELNNKK
jgi:hypothetical protein